MRPAPRGSHRQAPSSSALAEPTPSVLSPLRVLSYAGRFYKGRFMFLAQCARPCLLDARALGRILNDHEPHRAACGFAPVCARVCACARACPFEGG